MSTTTTKRGPGRPSTKTTEAPKRKLTVKQSIPTTSVIEYKISSKVEAGAAYMLSQSRVTVFDKERNEVREIRYCPNEPSIYRDEQSDFAVRKAIIFVGGRLFVRPDQPNLKAFLDAHPKNMANGGREFEVVNKEKKAEVKIENEFLIADAISMVRDKDINDLLGVAVAFGINIDRPVNEIKHDLLVFAKKSPQKFIESFDNPVVEMKAKIRQAAKFQIIKLEKDGVKWFDTNKLIVSVPAGKDPTDVFVRYCLTESAVPVLQEIEKQLSR